jgi:hypothetical protein
METVIESDPSKKLVPFYSVFGGSGDVSLLTTGTTIYKLRLTTA